MRKHLYSLLVITILICALAGVAAAQLDIPLVSIVTPVNGTTISGSQVEIAVGFDSTGDYPVSKVQVFLDGKPVTDRIYDDPIPNGICTFKWDTVRTPNGVHKVDVQVFSKDTYLGMASCTVTVSNKAPDLIPPTVTITSPKDGQVVSGVTPIIISASDNSGEPFVGVYVDNSLKLASNRGPYVYQWDTTKGENGPHTIEATASDQSDNTTKAKSIRVIVRNPVKMVPITALPAEETSTTVAQSVPVPPASTATPREPAAAKSESARTAPQANTDEKFEVDQTPKSAPAPAKADKLVPAVKEIPAKPVAKPATVAKPVETPAVPVAAPESTLSKPEQAPVLMAKLSSKDISQPTAMADNKLATPEAPKSQVKPVVKEIPAPVVAPVKMAKAEPVKVIKSEVSIPAKMVQVAPADRSAGSKEYVIQPGDTILELAKKFNVSARAIVELNNIKDPSLIVTGHKLLIPADLEMVQIRPVFEEMNGTVTWDQATKTVHAVSSQNQVELKIGSAGAVVNSGKVTMDGPAVVSSGRTLVPGSFVTKTLGMDVPAK